MKFTDLHCDTLMHMIDGKYSGKDINFYKNDLCIDLKRLKEADYRAQVFACFVDMGNSFYSNSYFDDALEMMSILKENLADHKGLINFAGGYDDYCENIKNNKISAFLSVEEGGIIGQDLDKLRILHNEGVRFITLTWNYENSIGYPNHKWTYQNMGLKKFGFEVLEYMDELGIIVDVSHLSDGGFNDVYKHGKRPFLATHSNARAIQNHNRNLSDEMIKELANKGGIMGLNFAAAFLNGETSSIESMVAHTKHILNVGGDDVLALGSDFDGIDPTHLEIRGAGQMPKLESAFCDAGLSPRQIENILYKNFENFLYNYKNF